jgi:hypothetical protein
MSLCGRGYGTRVKVFPRAHELTVLQICCAFFLFSSRSCLIEP